MTRYLMTSCATLAVTLVLCAPLSAQSIAGPYLAARQAAMLSDFSKASEYYTRALARDPSNVDLIESALVAHLSLGQVDRALPIAKVLASTDQKSQVAQMVLTADMVAREDYEALLGLETRTAEKGIGPLVDGLIQAWAQMGIGKASDALAKFDTVSSEPGLRSFAMFHKVLALAMVGDFEGAEALFEDEQTGLVMTRRGAMARAEILSQLDRNDDALQMLSDAFAGATDPELDALVAALETGEQLPFSHVTTAQEGLAEVFYSIAAALQTEAGPEYTLLYAQVAWYLRPDHIDALLLGAELLETLGQYDLAIAAYKKVPQTDVAYHVAELGRAAALRRSDRADAAIEVLEQLTRSHGQMAVVHSSLGDALRQEDRFDEAVVAYDTALSLTDEGARSQWFLLYARGIAHDRLGEWDKSEADFRAALERNPDQPQVLNYLGYSLVEQQVKLDEALSMIERAASASPNSGYIIDSLGWVLFRLGRYQDAVAHMERAVELMAVDPIVNDHLGDVYYAVGRLREAEFQWARALSFVDEDEVDGEADPDRIRQKLKVGLSKVLEAEGAPPLKIATD
ncbi:MAG: tetratricopeptide repeat protein [Sulfitobacter sp.]